MVVDIEHMKGRALKRFIGFGYIGTSIIDAQSRVYDGNIPPGVSWPLAHLELRASALEFGFYWRRVKVKYNEVSHLSIRRNGYIVVFCKDTSKTFGFGTFNLAELHAALLSKGLHFDETSNNLAFATTFNRIRQFLLIILALGLIFLAILNL